MAAGRHRLSIFIDVNPGRLGAVRPSHRGGPAHRCKRLPSAVAWPKSCLDRCPPDNSALTFAWRPTDGEHHSRLSRCASTISDCSCSRSACSPSNFAIEFKQRPWSVSALAAHTIAKTPNIRAICAASVYCLVTWAFLNPRRLGLYARGCIVAIHDKNSRDSAVLHGTQSRTVGNDRRFVSEKIRVLRMPTPLATNLLIALGSAILLRALGFISMPILALTLPVALWTATKITSSPKDKSLTERCKAPSPPREA